MYKFLRVGWQGKELFGTFFDKISTIIVLKNEDS